MAQLGNKLRHSSRKVLSIYIGLAYTYTNPEKAIELLSGAGMAVPQLFEVGLAGEIEILDEIELMAVEVKAAKIAVSDRI